MTAQPYGQGVTQFGTFGALPRAPIPLTAKAANPLWAI